MNSSNTNNRAIELSKILKDEQEWLRTRKESSHQSSLIIVSLELPVKIVRLERQEPSDKHDHGFLSGNSAKINDTDTQDKCVFEAGGVDERKRPRFGLKSSQHSLMRTLHSHRKELAKTVKFIGWPGIHVEREDEKEEIRELLEGIDCVPVFPPEVEFKSFNEFCQLFMWPLFHNVLNPEELGNAPFDHEQWRRYHQMNMLWSSVITPIVSPEHMDMVWINDYHLLLLCQYLTRRVKGVNIGLFLHIPFPSFEIFRCLPVREELLRSILMADLVGFHFFPYAKQFLSSCKRLLGLDHHFKPGGLIGIDKTATSSRSSTKTNSCLDSELSKQETIVRIGHVHIQCDDILHSIASNREILKRSQEIRSRYRDHYIFVSIDRLDQLSGLQLKLKAFDNFLQNYPYIKTEQPVVLIQYIFPTNTLTLEKRDKLIQSLVSLSNEINLRHSSSESFGNHVIEIKYGPITQEEKYSLFLSGNCLFDTSVRDGLNLNPFEYIICKDNSLTLPCCGSFATSFSSNCGGIDSTDQGSCKIRTKTAVGYGRDRTVAVSGPFCRLRDPNDLPSLIISEFTGCSNTLSSPYRVNPWNMMNVVETLDKAVCCQKGLFQEKRHHWNMDKAYLLSHSTVNWAKEFIMDLRILSERKKKDMLHFYKTTFGIGPSLMDIRINLNSQHLSLNLLSQVYRKADKAKGGFRLFLLDNEGTLTPDFRHFFDKICWSSSSSSSCVYSGIGVKTRVGASEECGHKSRTDGGVGSPDTLLSLLGSHCGSSKGRRGGVGRESSSANPNPPRCCSSSNSDCDDFGDGSDCDGDDFGSGYGSDCGIGICKEMEERRLYGSEASQVDQAKRGSETLFGGQQHIHPCISKSASSPPSLDSLSHSNHETALTINSNCTSVEALNLEGSSVTNTSISSLLNSISTHLPESPEERDGLGDSVSGDTSAEYKGGDGATLLLDGGRGGENQVRPGNRQERACEHELEELYSYSEISCSPPAQVVEALRKLCSSPNNLVVVFSGREKHLLDEWFGDIDNIGLCAEHGYYLKLPKSLDPAHPNTWRQLNIDSVCQDNHPLTSCPSSLPRYHPLLSRSTPCRTEESEYERLSSCSSYSGTKVEKTAQGGDDDHHHHHHCSNALLLTPPKQLLQSVSDWKNITLQLMEQYVLRTQGSYIENKGTALVFQFKYCEPYFGSWQAKELSNYLNELLINFPVNVISGNDYVEVRLQGIDKGVAVQAILDQICSLPSAEHTSKKLQSAGTPHSSPPLEMILCIGDDRSDEDMFSAVNRFAKSNKTSQGIEQNVVSDTTPPSCSEAHLPPNHSPKCEVFNVVIGKHSSLANYFLYSFEEVSDILQTLALFT